MKKVTLVIFASVLSVSSAFAASEECSKTISILKAHAYLHGYYGGKVEQYDEQGAPASMADAAKSFQDEQTAEREALDQALKICK